MAATTCRVLIKGRRCRAVPLRGGQYCYSHRFHEHAGGPGVTLADLLRLAEEFDRGADELYTATEFVKWCKPELAGLEG